MGDDTPQIRLYLEDAEAIDNLFRQALATKGPNAFADFLRFVERFNRFSIFNALLIHVQRPGASAVGGSRTQWRRIGRTVNADAVPVIVLQPFGPVDFMYELQDTAGESVPGREMDPFLAFGRVLPTDWNRTIEAAKKCRVVVEQVDNYGSGLAGTATTLHPASELRTGAASTGDALWRIKINGRLDESTRFATLAHELAHIYCGHQGTDHGNWSRPVSCSSDNSSQARGDPRSTGSGTCRVFAWIAGRSASAPARNLTGCPGSMDGVSGVDDWSARGTGLVMLRSIRCDRRGHLLWGRGPRREAR